MFSGNYRHPNLDYTEPGIFLITFKKKKGIPDFSFLHEDARFKESSKRISTRYFQSGQILRRSLEEFKLKNPSLGIIQHVIMPDHIHFIIHIKEKLDEHLGRYMGRLKALMLENIRKERFLPDNIGSLFSTGFNDQYLNPRRSLKVLINYVKENPYRLWIRRVNPEFFQRMDNIWLINETCSSYGNQFLLSNPNKVAVVAHRRFTKDELRHRINLWRYTIYNGGVLTGAFVHPLEKEILKEAITEGGKIIKFDGIPQHEKWKPTGKEFKMCEQGRMLIVSPHKAGNLKIYRKNPDIISREECKFFNRMAEGIESL